MKRILIILPLLFGVAYGQLCADTDTTRSNAVSLITYNSARITGTTAHFSVNPVSLQLRYVRVGQTDTATASSAPSTALRNLTGLQAATVYVYYYKTICGSGTATQSVAYYFTTLQSTVTYTPMTAQGYQYKYVKVDSGFIVPRLDTGLNKSPNIGGQIKFRPADSTFYGYDGLIWKPLAIDSSGIIALLNDKVDSVTVAGDSLWYWKQGVSYGYVLPTQANEWKLLGNANTSPSTDFIGTTDAQDLVFKTNAVERLRVLSSGEVGIGIAAPTSKLHVVPIQTAGIGVAVESSTTTSGSIMDITGTSTVLSANNSGLNISLTGTNATNGITARGVNINVTNENATSGTNLGLSVSASDARTANTGIYAQASGSQGTPINIAGDFLANGPGANTGVRIITDQGTTNVGLAVTNNNLGHTITAMGGNVGIGTTSPDSLLTVTGGGLHVNRGVRLSGIPTTGTIYKTLRITSNGTVIATDTSASGGSQTPWTSDIDADGFSLLNVPYIDASANMDIKAVGDMKFENTNAEYGFSAGYLSANKFLLNTANVTGTKTGTIQNSSGTFAWLTDIPASSLTVGTTAIASGTIGGIVFQGAGNVVQQDATNFFWDDGNNRLGIGTNAPAYKLDVNGNSTIARALAAGGAAEAYLFDETSTGFFGLIKRGSTAVGNMSLPAGSGEFLNSGGSFGIIAYGGSSYIAFGTNGANERMRLDAGGLLGIGVTVPTAFLHLRAGTASANTAPAKYSAGTNLTAIENGAFEYNGSRAFLSSGGTRQNLLQGVSGSFSQAVGVPTTVFTVTFGGTQPNATYQVVVTPTAALSAALFYVTNKTTTTFDVTYLAGLTGTVEFDYILSQ